MDTTTDTTREWLQYPAELRLSEAAQPENVMVEQGSKRNPRNRLTP
jgi:hypothetical protein